jgi:phage baseplate assembly protein W
MAMLSFKSVGKTFEKKVQEFIDIVPTPIGIKTPLQLLPINGLFTMNYNIEDQISDNLRNLLQTNFGERLGLYNFGANLKPLTVNFSSQDSFDSEAISRISSAISTWMPYIEPLDYVSEIDRSQKLNTGLVRITISYNISSIEVTNKKIQIALYVI